MTFWHMQLHPNDLNWNREEVFLGFTRNEEYKKLINQLKSDIDINDIILIKNNNNPIALVEVMGEYENKNNLYGKVVKVLDSQTKTMDSYPLGGNEIELKKIMEKDVFAYPYIKKWYEGNKEDLISAYKLKELYIENHLILHKFKISFCNKNNEPLSIIILAGINGSGKTTIFEYIDKIKYYIQPFFKTEDYLKLSYKNEDFIFNKEASKKKKEIDEYVEYMSKKNGIVAYNVNENGLFTDDLNKYITYISVYKDNINDIKKSILSYFRKRSRELDSIVKATKEIRNFILKVFDGVDLTFELLDVDDTDRDNEKVTFKNKNGKEFDIDALSTGEKTLLSKVLYLYFKDIKNQIILIDEPELSLHPAWQNRVLKLYENFAKENNCQIIIATHSPHIIGSAKNEYIRILTEDGVINDVLAYGRDIEWVLEEVMGASYTREPTIAKKIKECEELLNEDKYDEAEVLMDALELLIGENDSEVMSLRNSLEFWRE